MALRGCVWMDKFEQVQLNDGVQIEDRYYTENPRVGNVMGYSGVFQSNLHPYLSQPISTSTATGRGFTKTHARVCPQK